MDKVIVTVLLIISGLVASLAVFNGLYPAITQSSSSINSAAGKVRDRIESRIEIIQAVENGNNVDVWVKNVGTKEIYDIGKSDVFFGPSDNFTRITYGGTTTPYWDYQLEGGYSEWQQTITTKITIHRSSVLAANIYLLKVVIPNGISDDTTFSVD